MNRYYRITSIKYTAGAIILLDLFDNVNDGTLIHHASDICLRLDSAYTDLMVSVPHTATLNRQEPDWIMMVLSSGMME